MIAIPCEIERSIVFSVSAVFASSGIPVGMEDFRSGTLFFFAVFA